MRRPDGQGSQCTRSLTRDTHRQIFGEVLGAVRAVLVSVRPLGDAVVVNVNVRRGDGVLAQGRAHAEEERGDGDSTQAERGQAEGEDAAGDGAHAVGEPPLVPRALPPRLALVGFPLEM